MPERYADILARCLAFEDKAHRERVLLGLDPETAVVVRSQLQGLAKRLTAHIAYAGINDEQITKEQRRARRRERLEAIPEPWLRERVEVMVREHFAGRKS